MKKSSQLGAVCAAVTFKSNFKVNILKMRVMKKLLMLVILFVSSHLVNASIVVVGPQMLSDGRTVDLQGLQWLEVVSDTELSEADPGDYEYPYLSRDIVEANVLDSVSGGGWAYASVDQTTRLMASLVGDGSQIDKAVGGQWFIETFGQTDDWGGAGNAFLYGKSDECGVNVSCVSGVELSPDYYYPPYEASFASICYIFGDSCGGPLGGEGPWPDNEIIPYAGHLLVRAVPIPPAIWLFGSGLLGLVGIARRKKAA